MQEGVSQREESVLPGRRTSLGEGLERERKRRQAQCRMAGA